MSILLEAGKLYSGREFVDMPLPYGVTPRLVMVYVSTEAIRTQCRTVEIGQSMREFLTALGMSTSGGERGGYAALKRQMEALAACRLTLGMQDHGRVVTIDSKPIKRFEAWIQPSGGRGGRGEGDHDGLQQALWPGVLELSQSNHAVPLDYRALAALQHSALALDIYTWLAHRLCRVTRPQGVKLSWSNLRDQFGQEYADNRNFKHEFKRSLHQVTAVYPEARLGEEIGGLVLYPSHPPLSRTSVAMPQSLVKSTPIEGVERVDNSPQA
jgi:Plasmid encoded RepA protein